MHDIRHYDTRHKRLICDFVTLSIKALNIAPILSVTIYFIILLNAVMLSVRSYFVILLNTVIFSVVMLSVVAPLEVTISKMGHFTMKSRHQSIALKLLYI